MEAEEMMDGDGDGESSLYCRLHPAQSVVGICSACLQEKLGKLVFAERQSMFSNQEHHTSDHHHHHHNHIPSTKQANHEECKTNTTTTTTTNNTAGICGGIPNGNGRSRMLLNKSKSVAASSRRVVALQVTNPSSNNAKRKVSGSSSSSSAYPHSIAFWSFFSFGKKKHHPNGNDSGLCASTSQRVDLEVTGKLVTRSRSVGFGSRSFSADIYHRSPPVLAKKQEVRHQDEDEEDNGEYHNGNHHHHQNHNHGNVRCGGLFVGFGGMQSCDAGKDDDGCDKASSGCHSRSKSWSWAFSSPLRAFIHSSRRWTNKDSSNVSTITAQPPSSNGDSALEIDRG